MIYWLYSYPSPPPSPILPLYTDTVFMVTIPCMDAGGFGNDASTQCINPPHPSPSLTLMLVISIAHPPPPLPTTNRMLGNDDNLIYPRDL